jgi:hypothetical protein
MDGCWLGGELALKLWAYESGVNGPNHETWMKSSVSCSFFKKQAMTSRDCEDGVGFPNKIGPDRPFLVLGNGAGTHWAGSLPVATDLWKFEVPGKVSEGAGRRWQTQKIIYIYINSYEDMLMSKIQIHFEGGPFLFSFFQEENWLNTLLRHALLQICACWLYFATSGHSYTLTTDGHSAAFIFLMIDTWTFYPDWLQEIPVWFARPFGCLAPSSDFWRISTLPASCFFVLCFSSCLQRNFGKILTFCMFFYGALQRSLLAVASWYRSHALAVHALEPFFA